MNYKISELKNIKDQEWAKSAYKEMQIKYDCLQKQIWNAISLLDCLDHSPDHDFDKNKKPKKIMDKNLEEKIEIPIKLKNKALINSFLVEIENIDETLNFTFFDKQKNFKKLKSLTHPKEILKFLLSLIKDNPFFIWKLRNIWNKHPRYWFEIKQKLNNSEIIDYENRKQYVIYEILTRCIFKTKKGYLKYANDIDYIISIISKIKDFAKDPNWSGFKDQKDSFDEIFDQYFGLGYENRYSTIPSKDLSKYHFANYKYDPFYEIMYIQAYLMFLLEKCGPDSKNDPDIFLWSDKEKKVILNQENDILKNSHWIYKYIIETEIDAYNEGKLTNPVEVDPKDLGDI